MTHPAKRGPYKTDLLHQAVWVTAEADGGVAADKDSLWVLNEGDNTLSRIAL